MFPAELIEETTDGLVVSIVNIKVITTRCGFCL